MRSWIFCLPCAIALAVAPPAIASPHVFSFSITGSGTNLLSDPTDVAVDNSTGSSAHDIYVADPRNFRVEKFNPEGAFLLMFGKGVNKTKVEEGRPEAEQNVCAAGESCQSGTRGESPGSFIDPAHLAVDSSTGPSEGDVYVADSEDGRISKFDPFGHPITTWGSNGQLDIGGGFPGITVDPSGNLLVMENTGPTGIAEYTQEGGYVSRFLTGYLGRGIAVDSSGNIYMTTQQGTVEKYSSSRTDLGSIASSGTPVALAINPANGNLFVDDNLPDEIQEFVSECTIPDCSPLTSFGGGDLHGAYQVQGIASDGSDETLYVTNPSSSGTGQGGIAVFFRPGIVPEVTTGSFQPGHPKIVAGYIDPADAGAVTTCKFEYVADEQFDANGYADAETVPCTPYLPYLSATDVMAELPILQSNKRYTYRLVASNSRGSGTGADRTFTTLSSPGVLAGSAASTGDATATVYGTVEADAADIVIGCKVEYVEQATYSASGYAEAESVPCSPVPPYSTDTAVSANLANLAAGSTYHYRVIAANAERSTTGADGMFTTLPVEPELKPEKEESKHEPVPHGRIRCSRHPCSRILQGSTRVRSWSSSKFPHSYGTTFAIYIKGHSLPVSDVADHCIATFRGPDLIATLNECHGMFRLIYLGSGPFKIRWRVFA